MTYTVSVGDFRNNLSDYLAMVRLGNSLVIKDERKNEEIVEVIPKKKFDVESYLKTLHEVAGTFTAKNHPEWATKAKVIKWLEKSRLADERHFDVPN